MGWKPPQKCSGVCHVGFSCVTYLISPLGIRQYISKNSVSRWWINCICFPRFSSLCWYKKGSWLLLWRSRPFNSDVWPRQKFSLLNQHNIKEARDENKEKYQLWDYLLIRYQILRTNITRTVWQTVRRITDEVLGAEEVKEKVFKPSTAVARVPFPDLASHLGWVFRWASTFSLMVFLSVHRFSSL